MDKPYEFLSHPADIKIKAYGRDIPELFFNSAKGMMAFLFENHLEAKPVDSIEKVEVQGNNMHHLFINWLSEVLWLATTKYAAASNFQLVEFKKKKKFAAEIGLVKAKAVEDIKAVTYHELSIKKVQDEYEAEVVFDI